MNGECIPHLMALGISHEDAQALRRIAMTLHRWHELECGDSNNYASWCVVRGDKKGNVFEYNDEGKPWMEYHRHDSNRPTHIALADRENGAKKRLAGIMAKYPTLTAYIQGDPRGAALYILRPGDVPKGQDADSYYSRGIAVYK